MLMARLLHYLKPYRFLVVASLAMVVIRAVIDLYLPQLTADIIDIGVVNADIPFILRVGALMLAVAGRRRLQLTGSYFAAGFHRLCMIEKLSLPMWKASCGNSTSLDRILITGTTNDIQQLQMVVMTGLRMMVMARL